MITHNEVLTGKKTERKMKKTLLLLLLALLAAPLCGQQTYGELSTEQLRQAANNGDAIAQGALGERYAEGDRAPQDYKQAVYWYTKAANQGVAVAQYYLGVCYNEGWGVTQDYKQAVYWWTKAANQGDAEAQYNLGVCYYKGDGVTKDYKQAVYWYTKAANQGIAEAQYNLGGCYYTGEGVATDCGAARYWFEQADKRRDQLQELPRNLLVAFLSATSDCTPNKPAAPTAPTTPRTTTPTTTSTSTSTTPRSPVSTPTTTSSGTRTGSSSGSGTSSGRSKYSRWPWYYRDFDGAFQISYTQRSLHGRSVSDGLEVREAFMGDGEWSSGFSLGFHFNPSLDWGLGLHWGFFYEMTFERYDAPSEYYDSYLDVNLYVPLNVAFRIPFSPHSALFLRCGIGVDIGIYAELYDSRNYGYESYSLKYGKDSFFNRINTSLEYGASLRLEDVMFHVTYQRGLSTHPMAAGYRVTLDKVNVGISFPF